MEYRYPDFYPDFQCRAGECRHSCCKGWEIHIDEETCRRYRELPAPERNEILSHLQPEDGGAQMILTEDEACPFLDSGGLCQLIVRYGEDYISGICHEHPRFYHEFSGVTEIGLGLSCEAVTDLLLDGEEEYTILREYDGEEETGEPDAQLRLADRFRDTVDRELSREGSFHEAINRLLQAYGVTQLPPAETLAKRYLKLEILEPDWGSGLRRLAEHPVSEETIEQTLEDPCYGRILRYLAYRNAPEAKSPAEQLGLLKVLVSGLTLMAALRVQGMELRDTVRLFSAEIEYSDCAIGELMQAL